MPSAFLIPGVFGVDAGVVALRNRMRDRLDLKIVDLPDVGSSGRILSDMSATASQIATCMNELQNIGTINIVGYSFGASLALEAIRHLTILGRSIGSVVIIDGPMKVSNDIEIVMTGDAHSTPVQGGQLVYRGAKTAVRYVRSALLAEYRKRFGIKSDLARRGMLMHLRKKAIRNWEPQESLAKGLYISTNIYGAENTSLWRALCPCLHHLHFDIEHTELLSGQTLDSIAKEITALFHEPSGLVTHGGKARAMAEA